jgi:hypothetical protein
MNGKTVAGFRKIKFLQRNLADFAPFLRIIRQKQIYNSKDEIRSAGTKRFLKLPFF